MKLKALLLFVFLLGAACPAWAVISFSQLDTILVEAVSSGTSAGINTSANSLLVFNCSTWSGAPGEAITPSDSAGLTWAENASSPKNPTTQTYVQQFWAINSGGTVGHTFTATTGGTGAYITCFILEFTGNATGTAIDTTAGQNEAAGGSGTTSSGATGTRSQANEVLVGVMGTGATVNVGISAGSGFTIPFGGSQGISADSIAAIEYQVVSSVGTDACTFGVDNTTDATSTICGTFKASATVTLRQRRPIVMQ